MDQDTLEEITDFIMCVQQGFFDFGPSEMRDGDDTLYVREVSCTLRNYLRDFPEQTCTIIYTVLMEKKLMNHPYLLYSITWWLYLLRGFYTKSVIDLIRHLGELSANT